MPVPIIIPRSTSRTPATFSSTTRHASTSAFRNARSASLGSTCWDCGVSVLIEAPPALGAEVALLDQLLHRTVDVHAVAVGLAQVARDLDRRSDAREVRRPD